MKLEVLAASEHEKPILRRMLELYQHDLSPFEDMDLNEHGEFGYGHLDHYWTESGRYPFLAKLADKLVGFALVNIDHYLPGSDYSMAEFFVLKRYRRRGHGRTFARHVFDALRGTWEVSQLRGNVAAHVFWKNTIHDYTCGAFEEITDGYGDWQGPILQFINAQTANPAPPAAR